MVNSFFCLGIAILLCSQIHAQKSGRWSQVEYGPYLTASIEAPMPRGNIAYKGIAVRVGETRDSYMVFDCDTMRWSAAWTGKRLNWQSIVYDGSHGTHLASAGTQVFGNGVGPG